MPHPTGHLLALGRDGHQLFLHVHCHELGKKGEMVARVEPVPHREKYQCGHLADDPVIHELEPLVDITGGPAIRIDVEGLDEMAEFGGRLQPSDLDVGAPRPVHAAVVLLQAVVAQAGQDADALCGEPESNVLGQENLTPEAEKEEAYQEIVTEECGAGRPHERHIHGADKMEEHVDDSQAQPLEAVPDRGGRQ